MYDHQLDIIKVRYYFNYAVWLMYYVQKVEQEHSQRIHSPSMIDL